jgi:hypothetical protein
MRWFFGIYERTFLCICDFELGFFEISLVLGIRFDLTSTD